MNPVDTKTRRTWPPYWCNHKLKAIRLQCLRDFGESDGNPTHAYTGVCRAIDRCWAKFCEVPRDLEAYRHEDAHQRDNVCAFVAPRIPARSVG